MMSIVDTLFGNAEIRGKTSAPASLPPKIAASRLMTEHPVKPLKSEAEPVEQQLQVYANDTKSVESILRHEMELAAVRGPEVEQSAFFVADLGEVIRQHQQWLRLMPRVEPFFAIKSNPDPAVLQTLADFQTGFDCASQEEIRQVLNLGVSPDRIIFANPCKQIAHIRYAASVGVRMMTFDNTDELDKVARHYPSAELVLRILVDDSKSVCKFGVKFGASLAATQMLLERAIQLSLNVIGVSFHVGSGCYEASAFGDAVVRARTVFDQAEQLGLNLRLLDIGGGFPGAKSTNGLTFEAIANVLNPKIDQLFPDRAKVRVIAEPGRYYVHSVFTLACNITSRRVVPRDRGTSTINTVNGPIASKDDQPSYMYYINDGVYGSFNCILFDHVSVTARPLMRSNGFVNLGEESSEEQYNCSIWGPTCDSMDCLTREGMLPVMTIGDWLLFECMGAYTMCAASEFNGFAKPRIVYTNTAKP